MRSSEAIAVLLAVLAAGAAPGYAAAQQRFSVSSAEVTVKTGDGYVKIVFSDRDKESIREYYGRDEGHHSGKKGKHKKLPPGLAKKGSLPPGLQKRLDAGQPLPPGLHKKRLPRALERNLERLPKEYIRLKVGGDIVIMDRKTSVVVDVVNDVGW